MDCSAGDEGSISIGSNDNVLDISKFHANKSFLGEHHDYTSIWDNVVAGRLYAELTVWLLRLQVMREASA